MNMTSIGKPGGTGTSTTNDHVKEDYSNSDSNDVTGDNGPSSTRDQSNSNDSHLTADGQVDGSGVVSGTFTYKGDIDNKFSLHDESGTDGSGNANSTGAGFTAITAPTPVRP